MPGVRHLRLPPFLATVTSMPGSVHSLDTISDTSSDVSLSSDDEDRLLEQEWQESLEQLQQLVSIVLLPWVGKFLGRRWSHWGAYLPPFYRIASTSSPPNCPTLI